MYESLPLYQCFKKVMAAKIAAIDDTGTNGGKMLTIILPDGSSGSIPVDAAYLTRCPKLAVGGYFVVYQEGDKYTSYSPAEPFEGGYRLITSETPLPASALIQAKKTIAEIEAMAQNGPHDVPGLCDKLRGQIDEVIENLLDPTENDTPDPDTPIGEPGAELEGDATQKTDTTQKAAPSAEAGEPA